MTQLQTTPAITPVMETSGATSCHLGTLSVGGETYTSPHQEPHRPISSHHDVKRHCSLQKHLSIHPENIVQPSQIFMIILLVGIVQSV